MSTKFSIAIPGKHHPIGESMGFEIKQRIDGQYYWRLKARNGEILAHSEGYPTPQAAQAGIEACCRVVLAVCGR